MTLTKVFTKREKFLLVFLAVLMVFAAYYLSVYRPVTDSLNSIRAQQAEADTAVLELESKSIRLEQMRTELETILADPTAVEIPTYNNLQKLMAFLNTILSTTADYNLSFEAPELPAVTAPAVPAEEGAAAPTPDTSSNILRRYLTMTFTCATYAQARDVANQLHNGPYRCQVQTVSIAPASMQQFSSKEAADVNIETFPVLVSVSVMYYEIME